MVLLKDVLLHADTFYLMKSGESDNTPHRSRRQLLVTSEPIYLSFGCNKPL